MLTKEQLLNNIELEKKIREADAEYDAYIKFFDEKRKQFYKDNINLNSKITYSPTTTQSYIGNAKYAE